MRRVLVIGALGQIGTELVPALRARFGADQVVASDLRVSRVDASLGEGPFELLDCTRSRQLSEVVRHYAVDTIYHLAALLSASAEERPRLAWEVNMGGLYRVLEVARSHGAAVFFPSSIGAFGPSTPRVATPQQTIQRPTTIYGVTKVSGELLCDYYWTRFGVDTRGLRLPGLISHGASPGGGTTDYAVEMFFQALRYQHYTCFLRSDTRLDMMYMPDAIRAMIELMEADPVRLRHRNAYNISAMSIDPRALSQEIREHIPQLVVDYEVDPLRQAIADSWPQSVDDCKARQEWGWKARYDLAAMTVDMLAHLRTRIDMRAHGTRPGVR